MRIVGPLIERYRGDPIRAQGYLGIARTLLGRMLSARGEVTSIARTWRLNDGAIITTILADGSPIVQIDVTAVGGCEQLPDVPLTGLVGEMAGVSLGGCSAPQMVISPDSNGYNLFIHSAACNPGSARAASFGLRYADTCRREFTPWYRAILFGAIDWTGRVDGDLRVISYAGNSSRYFLAYNGSAGARSAFIYEHGRVLAKAPGQVWGACLRKESDGAVWVVAIIQRDGLTERVVKRRAVPSSSDALYDPGTAPNGWIVIGDTAKVVGATTEQGIFQSIWCFNESGTEASTVRYTTTAGGVTSVYQNGTQHSDGFGYPPVTETQAVNSTLYGEERSILTIVVGEGSVLKTLNESVRESLEYLDSDQKDVFPPDTPYYVSVGHQFATTECVTLLAVDYIGAELRTLTLAISEAADYDFVGGVGSVSASADLRCGDTVLHSFSLYNGAPYITSGWPSTGELDGDNEWLSGTVSAAVLLHADIRSSTAFISRVDGEMARPHAANPEPASGGPCTLHNISIISGVQNDEVVKTWGLTVAALDDSVRAKMLYSTALSRAVYSDCSSGRSLQAPGLANFGYGCPIMPSGGGITLDTLLRYFVGCCAYAQRSFALEQRFWKWVTQQRIPQFSGSDMVSGVITANGSGVTFDNQVIASSIGDFDSLIGAPDSFYFSILGVI